MRDNYFLVFKMNNKKNKKSKSWTGSLNLAFQLGYMIALPLVGFALSGRLLDKKFGTSPWLLLAGITSSLIVTSWIIYIKISKIIAKLEQCERKKRKSIKEEEL